MDFDQINLILKLRLYSKQIFEVTCVIIFGMLQQLAFKGC